MIVTRTPFRVFHIDTFLSGSSNDLESLITRADDALYQAKRNGRNQIHPPVSEAALSA